MNAKSKLRRALDSIRDAQSNLTVANGTAEHAQHYARLAADKLRTATSEIEAALRELPGN